MPQPGFGMGPSDGEDQAAPSRHGGMSTLLAAPATFTREVNNEDGPGIGPPPLARTKVMNTPPICLDIQLVLNQSGLPRYRALE